ncbi:flagellar hook capping FlgD N-terminal domain-containing protein [Sedimentibacter sp.]|uniref:flagellar hook capping FlgD N-terminal domain-containing protein n=1 Tax=Sedimentibacter sp. TaxID=1960295 RepID=UPI0028ACDFE2|nr:flagellar hook capping FlgD N-terminal domain-containing protein [Sedimentibacter sp.]
MPEINGYGTQSARYGSQVDDKELNIQTGNEGLQMQDFLNLLVAQITNQDAMNPMDNTEFISQMAQFSSLQAMSDLTKMAIEGQATSLIGKNVVVADYDDMGRLVKDEGIVQKVTIYGNQTSLYVNDKEYFYSNVMEVKQAEPKEDEEDPVLDTLKGILSGINKLNAAESDENDGGNTDENQE